MKSLVLIKLSNHNSFIMKKLSLFFAFCILTVALINAQVPPQGFNYSGVARNSNGQPIASTQIGVQISLLKSSATGTLVYSENHVVNTDAFGLFNLIIGGGSIQSGSMANIAWNSDNFFVKVGLDVSGVSNFLDMGTTQLLSVPYAMHAKTADNGIDHVSGDTIYLNNGLTYFIGVGGGSGSNLDNLPVLSATFYSHISFSKATLHSEVTADNGFSISSRGFVISNSSTIPTITNNTGIYYQGSGIGVFSSQINGLSPNTTYFIRAFSTNANGTSYSSYISFTTTTNLNLTCNGDLCLGDYYQGGTLAYFFQPGDLGYDANTTHGIIITENNLNNNSNSAIWGCYGTLVGTQVSIQDISTTIGNALINTTLIASNCLETNTAAKYCSDLILNNYSDWLLPSIGDLEAIYNSLFSSGIIGGEFISSSEFSENQHYSFAFDILPPDGYGGGSLWNKFQGNQLRAVRYF